MTQKSTGRRLESKFEKQIALVLQGGGALGSYQAGVYEALAEHDYQPDSEEEVVRNVMLRETVDGEFTTTQDVTEAALFFATATTNALTGQSLIVSHGWFME